MTVSASIFMSPPSDPAPMGVTDEDETLVTGFGHVEAVRRQGHDHDHHEQQASRMNAMATSIMMTTTTMESNR
jgi:hypothetical protein